jgi:hypothetical protein
MTLPSLTRLRAGDPTGVNNPTDLAPDLVVAVLVAINDGDAKRACRTAASWCTLNRLHTAACDQADGAWFALAARIFPNAPAIHPNDGRANFNALCYRITEYETGTRLLQPNSADVAIEPYVRAAIRFDPIAALAVAPEWRGNPNIVREAVRINGLALQYDGVRNDIGIVRDAVQQNPMALQYTGFRNTNIWLCRLAVTQDGLALQHVGGHIQALDDNVPLIAVRQNGLALQYAIPQYKNGSDMAHMIQEEAIKQNPSALRYASLERRSNLGFVWRAVRRKGRALQWASENLQANRELVMDAVADDASALEFASVELQADEEVRATAARQLRYDAPAEPMIGALSYVRIAPTGAYTPSMNDEGVALVLERIDASDAEAACRAAASWVATTPNHADSAYRVHEAWEELARRVYGPPAILPVLDSEPRGQFYSLCERMRMYRDGTYRISYPASPNDPKVKAFVRAAMKFQPRAFADADVSLKRDNAFVLSVVRENGERILYCTSYPNIIDDPEIIYAASRTYPVALDRASQRLQQDRAFVIRCIKQNTKCLMWAKHFNDTDEGVVISAVEMDGMALDWAGPSMCRNPRVVIAAVTQNAKAINYAMVDNAEIYEAYRKAREAMDIPPQTVEHRNYMLRRNMAGVQGLGENGENVYWADLVVYK